jgi:hypothetical protein
LDEISIATILNHHESLLSGTRFDVYSPRYFGKLKVSDFSMSYIRSEHLMRSTPVLNQFSDKHEFENSKSEIFGHSKRILPGISQTIDAAYSGKDSSSDARFNQCIRSTNP